MSYLVTALIIVVLIVVGFILLVFLPSPQCYFDVPDICENLLLLSSPDEYKKMQDELAKVGKTTVIYKDNEVLDNSHLVTYDLLRTIPNLRYAAIVCINEKYETKKHKSDTSANTRLRCILPIKISGAKKSSLWCEGTTKFFIEGEWIIYDHSRDHIITNKHKHNKTTLLVVDVDRPSWIPLGIAKEEDDKKICDEPVAEAEN
jgi:hypothetical protein